MIRVYIATTQGPVAVQRLSQEDPALRSVICLNGTAETLPISRAYDNFVKEPTGVIQRHYDHPTFRMDVATPITDGKSWQLGAFIAHALAAEDLLAAPDDSVDTVLWLSGEVDRDLNVRPVEHIQEKLKQSQDFFDQMRTQDIRVLCYIPGGQGHVPDDETLDTLGADGHLLQLEAILSVRRILQRLSLNELTVQPQEEEAMEEDEEDEDNFESDHGPYKDNLRHKIIGLSAAVLLVLGGLYLQFQDTVRALRVGNLEIGLAEIHSASAQNCQNSQDFKRIGLSLDGPQAPDSTLADLCAIDITLTNHGRPLYLWVFAHRLSDGHFLLADRDRLLDAEPLQGTIGWRLTIPPYLQESIDYRIVTLAADTPLGPAIDRLTRQLYAQDQFNWPLLKSQLEEQDITVLSVLHSLRAE